MATVDYKIDLLKCNSHKSTSDFINTMFVSSFIPLINRPTRITNSSGTIIDNIFTTCHNIDYISGILPMNISDHFPIFMSLVDTSKPELEQEETTTRRVVNTETINNCLSNLQNICWDNVLDNTDLNHAYDIFICKLNHVIK